MSAVEEGTALRAEESAGEFPRGIPALGGIPLLPGLDELGDEAVGDVLVLQLLLLVVGLLRPRQPSGVLPVMEKGSESLPSLVS